jgi:hypothetical protein
MSITANNVISLQSKLSPPSIYDAIADWDWQSSSRRSEFEKDPCAFLQRMALSENGESERASTQEARGIRPIWQAEQAFCSCAALRWRQPWRSTPAGLLSLHAVSCEIVVSARCTRTPQRSLAHS